ncbi:MAG: metallopeptidase [Planctomycetes bacterium]|nr:metallopeptidase [Planctomycetota bacterium]MBL7039571.1 metallopeptidase [Pirellulaceae bacterium]
MNRRRIELLVGCVTLMVVWQCSVADESGADSRGKPKPAEGVRFDPVVQKIEGWTVHVDPAMLDGEHKEEGARALGMLANHLQRIAVLMPEDRLRDMQKLEIWIEHHHPTLGSMQYHPNIGWLRSHGHDPRLAKKVHITRASSLLSRQQMIKHPAVVLHELAHAYHDQILSFGHPEIIKAYKKAESDGTYKEVLLYTGKRVRHYALKDHKEYFAEGTEAYFYRNDFYPFVRAELREHDPTLHDLLVEIWGPLE